MVESTYSARKQSSFDSRLRSALQAFICCALLLAFSAVSYAQTATGQFNGHVFDENGAVLVGAKVTLLNAQSGLSRTATTNGEGLYLFPLLQPGNYTITAVQDGFQSAVSPTLRLDVNQIGSQDFHMQVGQISETITVSASAELLQASSTEMGTVVEERTVNELPLNGRNFTSLLTLAPGVNAVNYSQIKSLDYGSGLSAPGLPTATLVSPSVQGQWNRENVYYLDGIINTSAMGGSYDIPPIVDVIQEFKVQSHNDVAEFGGVLGGVVNMVTKSGTNKYHGVVWEYLRNNAFDARNPFTDKDTKGAIAPASFRQNEFGGTIGGPVRIPKLYNGTDKTFFFFGYEGWRYSKAAGASYVSPTAAELDGDFTNSSVLSKDPITGQPIIPLLYNPFTLAGTPANYTRQLLGGDGRHVPASMIDPVAQAFLKNYGDTANVTPTTPGGPNTILNAVGTNNANQYNGRIDQNFGSNNMLWFRYSVLAGSNMTPTQFHLANTGSTTNRNYGGGYTHVFSPTLIFDARAGYSGRFNAVSETKPIGVSAPSGYPGVETVYGHASFGLNGGYQGVGGSGPSGSTLHELNYAANMTWIRGNHQIRFGFQQVIPEMTQGQSGNRFGGASFTFDAEETSNPQLASSTGNSLASALLGVPHNGRFQSPNNAVRIYSTSAYIQDSWKATPRLTINAGLRWDGESSPRLLIGGAAMMDPNTGNWIVSGGKLPPACNPGAGIFAPCIPSTTPENDAILAAHVVPAANPNLGPDGVYTDFGPRLGVAYKIDSSTVVRAGYGLVYDNLQGGLQTVRDRLLAWPSNASLPLTFNSTGRTVQTMTQITPTLSNTNALPAVSEPFHQSGWYYDPKMKNHYSHQWNVELQKELRSNLVASIAYVGSTNGRLPLTGMANNSREPGDGGVHRPFPWAGSQIMITDRGTANYNALQTKIEKRMSSGFALGAGYTWSKSMDNGASGFFNTENGPAGGSQVQNYYDLSKNYGLSGNSIGHIVYGWVLYELPFGKNKPFLNHGAVSYLVGGWQANTSLSAHSGPPLTFPDNASDPANIGNTTQKYARASIKAGMSPKLANPTFKEAFNTKAFESVLNVFGNSGRGIMLGMPFDNVDFSLMKGVSFAEKATLQFRAEFFNVFNIQNYGLPGTTYGANGFGVITGLAPGSTPRQVQLGLRASF